LRGVQKLGFCWGVSYRDVGGQKGNSPLGQLKRSNKFRALWRIVGRNISPHSVGLAYAFTLANPWVSSKYGRCLRRAQPRRRRHKGAQAPTTKALIFAYPSPAVGRVLEFTVNRLSINWGPRPQEKKPPPSLGYRPDQGQGDWGEGTFSGK